LGNASAKTKTDAPRRKTSGFDSQKSSKMKEAIVFSINSIDAKRSGFDIPASFQMASDHSERADPRRFTPSLSLLILLS
jgi:hypothetical protein